MEVGGEYGCRMDMRQGLMFLDVMLARWMVEVKLLWLCAAPDSRRWFVVKQRKREQRRDAQHQQLPAGLVPPFALFLHSD